jgi:hypothetical protein
MRALRWFPLTFLAGLHGFALFAAYAAFVMALYLVARSVRRARFSRSPLPAHWTAPRPARLLPTA